MKKNRLFDALLWLVLLWAFIGLFYTPYDPQSQAFTEDRLTGPTASHLLGIDGLGRDLFSRIWLGSGHSIGMGVLATLGNLSLAGLLLFLEQKSPGWVSRFLLSFISGWLAIPVLFIALLLLVYFDQGPPEPSLWPLRWETCHLPSVSCECFGVTSAKPSTFRPAGYWVRGPGIYFAKPSGQTCGPMWSGSVNSSLRFPSLR